MDLMLSLGLKGCGGRIAGSLCSTPRRWFFSPVESYSVYSPFVYSPSEYPMPNSGDAFDREIASDGLNAITWFKTNRDLILGTLNEEFLIKSSDGKAISNTNISILSQTSYFTCSDWS
jgi:hypothetical protein